ncbi:hypothetical protein FACS189459_1640 [Bacilli bacterium]|nr:hypothetical protein FACS189459_1640 [Bacilli bacterium]
MKGENNMAFKGTCSANSKDTKKTTKPNSASILGADAGQNVGIFKKGE